ncbi:MAG: hypothetical protein ACHQ01_08370, partial [Candidatus Limnocylindrales bacterium]
DDGAAWSVVQSPSDPSFFPFQLIPLGNTLSVLGHGVPGERDPDLRRRAGTEVSGTIVAAAVSGSAGTAANLGTSTAASSGFAFWASTDRRNWTALASSPSPVYVISNLAVFNGRIVAVTVGPALAPIVPKVMSGDLR